MVLFPYSDLTSSKSPIAIIFVSPNHIVLRPRLKKLFGNFFFTRINGKRYLLHANNPVKWVEGIGRAREFHFFSIIGKNGNAFSPELLQRISQYKIQNKIPEMTETLRAVSTDLRTQFSNVVKMQGNKKIADALERKKEAKKKLTEDDFEDLSKELGITIADYVAEDSELTQKEKESILTNLARQGLTHVFEPIPTGILNDLKNYMSFDPSWMTTLLNATQQTELEHKKLEARASKGFNKLFLMGIFGGLIAMLLIIFLATADINLTLPEFRF